MAKRIRTDVDEEAIKRMMSGDIPSLNTQIPKKEAISQSTPTLKEANEEKTPPERAISKSDKKRGVNDYTSVFLKKREPSNKKQVYITRQLCTKLSEILAVIANDLSVTTFIDNVLSEHIEQYKNEINDLYETKTKKSL